MLSLLRNCILLGLFIVHTSEDQRLCIQRRGVLRFPLHSNASSGVISVEFFHNDETVLLLNVSTELKDNNDKQVNFNNSRINSLEIESVNHSHEGTYERVITFENGTEWKDIIRLSILDPCLSIRYNGSLQFPVKLCKNVTCLTSPGGHLSFKGVIMQRLDAHVCIGHGNQGIYHCCSMTGKCRSKNVIIPYSKKSVCVNSDATLEVIFDKNIDGKVVHKPKMLHIGRYGRTNIFSQRSSRPVLISQLGRRFVELVGWYRPRFKNVQRIDEGLYIISLRVLAKGMKTTATIAAFAELYVKDPCFEKAEFNNKTHCLETDCSTNAFGFLIYNGTERKNHKVKVCKSSENGIYRCCSRSGTYECITQTISFKDEVTGSVMLHSDRGLTFMTLVLPLASSVATMAIVITIALVYTKCKRSSCNPMNVYFGVDGQHENTVAFQTSPLSTSVGDDEVYSTVIL